MKRNICLVLLLARSTHAEKKGIYRYKYTGGVVSEKTNVELEAEAAAIPKPEPTQAERLKALEDAVMEMLIM